MDIAGNSAEKGEGYAVRCCEVGGKPEGIRLAYCNEMEDNAFSQAEIG